MQLGMVGLGRMGANIVRRLMRARPRVRRLRRRTRTPCASSRDEGAIGAASLEDFVGKLDRAAGGLDHGAGRLRRRDRRPAARADGRRATSSSTAATPTTATTSTAAERYAARGIHYVDVGTSGGVFGLERGFCLMIGGEDETVAAPGPDLRGARAGRRRRRAHARPRRGDADDRPSRATCTAGRPAPGTS